MKKHLFILLILPTILVLTAVFLRYTLGPYWIGYNCDPEYVCLIQSLALAESKETSATVHPGTTLQMLGAASLKITDALDLADKDSLEMSVLKKPEFYLNIINIVLIFFNVVILFIIGIVSFKLTSNIWLSLLIQFSPFISIETLTQGLIRIAPEPLLLFTCLLFSLILIKMIFSESSKSAHGYMIALAFASGLGMATKVTFAPLLIIPLLALPKFRIKLLYLFFTGLFFVLWTWPIISQYEILFNWYYQILRHTGYYGLGESGIIDSGIYFREIANLLLRNPLFFIIWLFSAGFILMSVWPLTSERETSKKSAWDETSFRILFAVVVAQLCLILMTAKHPPDRNLLPALSLSGFSLFLIFLYLQRMDYFQSLNVKTIVIFTSIFFILSGVWRIIDMRTIFILNFPIQQEAFTINQLLKSKYKDFYKISYYYPDHRSSSQVDALAFGNFFITNGLYTESLQRIYGEAYFYNTLNGQFHTWTKKLPIEDIILSGQGNKIIIHGPLLRESTAFLISTIDSNPDSWKRWLSIKDFSMNNYIEKTPYRIGSILHLKDVFGGVHQSIYTIEGITVKDQRHP